MEIYKALQVKNDTSRETVNTLVSLFSDTPSFLTKNEKFVCVKYNPDTYLSNEKKISNLYKQKVFKPLIITNYKFLALLLQLNKSNKIDAEYTDFYFSNTEYDETDDQYILKEEIKEYIKKDTLDFEELLSILSDSDYNIKFVEFKVKKSTDYVTIYTSGNIKYEKSIENVSFETVLDIIEFLFTGSVSYE
ncbi:hypothetical protein [Lactococcus lactis]|uniref:hypothetical protein n=1 Tax=Lactococcus lactis TaxID=1358 RepID=UPI0024178B5A|nr:hypothetical protein [Lactococcus lactis]MDG4957320.1 hypothetical protein [Lactococcus lactis]